MPGAFVIDHPTLINLGFEWVIEGDDNRNAQVEVSYRKQGETQWKQGLPLLRLQGERIYQAGLVGRRLAQHVRRQHSGPGARHRLRSALRDVRSGRRVGQAADRDEDRDGAHAPGAEAVCRRARLPRLSADYKGTKIEPAFDGLMCAYNYYCGGGDTTTTARPRVKPGDTILVHAGLYKYHSGILRPDRSRQCDDAVSKAPTT